MCAVIAPFGVLTSYHHQRLGKYIELDLTQRLREKYSAARSPPKKLWVKKKIGCEKKIRVKKKLGVKKNWG